MTQQFGVIVALADNLGLTPSTHNVAHNLEELQFQGI